MPPAWLLMTIMELPGILGAIALLIAMRVTRRRDRRGHEAAPDSPAAHVR
jgi:hypothetical protein